MSDYEIASCIIDALVEAAYMADPMDGDAVNIVTKIVASEQAELLAALREIADGASWCEDRFELIALARAALAKAEEPS